MTDLQTLTNDELDAALGAALAADAEADVDQLFDERARRIAVAHAAIAADEIQLPSLPRLTPNMLEALAACAGGRHVRVNTYRALRERGLVNGIGAVTPLGTATLHHHQEQ